MTGPDVWTIRSVGEKHAVFNPDAQQVSPAFKTIWDVRYWIHQQYARERGDAQAHQDTAVFLSRGETDDFPEAGDA